jgi:hypothetical protein
MNKQWRATAKHWLRRARLFGVIAALVAGSIASGRAQSSGALRFDLDTFEAPLRVVQPASTDRKYLWNLVFGTNDTTISTTDKHDGVSSLRNRFLGAAPDGASWQFQFYPTTEGLSGTPNQSWFARQYVTNPSGWVLNRINRMRIWIKLPANLHEEGDGSHNFELGTYARCSTCGGYDYESGGGHFYHFYDLGTTGAWEQLIVDMHPNHVRSLDGNTEWGEQLHPTGESGYNYFDLLTRFYFDFPYATGSGFPVPADFYIDGVEFYEETRPENVAQVYSLHAAYIQSTNTLKVGWMHSKQETTKHEVRYAFSDIHTLGWANATAAPNGVVTPQNTGGYNAMYWSSNAVTLSGRSMVYVAIKPQNSNSIRQIAIPITGGSGSSAVPTAPSNLRITS